MIDLSLPLSLKVWLATKTYDSIDDPKTISATSLLRPTKSLVLGQRVNQEETEIDLYSQIPSAIGTSIHTAIEDAWNRDELADALSLSGVSEGIINRLVVNPQSTTDVDIGDIPIYMEIRSSKSIREYTITGKFDFVCDGVLEDFKSTGTYNWISQSNAEKYVQQGSIYRWLNPEIITAEYMWIRYIFTDWSSVKARTDKNYPQSRILSQKYSLLSLAETEQLIQDKINAFIANIYREQDVMPACTPEELWQKKPVYKYYKDPSKKNRSTKNFKTEAEAYNRYVDDGSVGEVVKVPGEIVFCKYCNAVGICNQAQKYIDQGLLTV